MGACADAASVMASEVASGRLTCSRSDFRALAPRPTWVSVGIEEASRDRFALRHRARPSWRDGVQSRIHDAAETPLVARMIAGQGMLMLAGASLYVLHASWECERRARAARAPEGDVVEQPCQPSRLPVVATVAASLALAWATFAFISRTRAFPAITALATYGRAFHHYLLPLRLMASAA